MQKLETFAERLIAARTTAQLSRAALARKMERPGFSVNQQVIANIEAGKTATAPYDFVRAAAQALGVSADWLYLGTLPIVDVASGPDSFVRAAWTEMDLSSSLPRFHCAAADNLIHAMRIFADCEKDEERLPETATDDEAGRHAGREFSRAISAFLAAMGLQVTAPDPANPKERIRNEMLSPEAVENYGSALALACFSILRERHRIHSLMVGTPALLAKAGEKECPTARRVHHVAGAVSNGNEAVKAAIAGIGDPANLRYAERQANKAKRAAEIMAASGKPPTTRGRKPKAVKPCPCGSGKMYGECHLTKDAEEAARAKAEKRRRAKADKRRNRG